MAETLGIYFENNIVKYAKLKSVNKSVELEEHGIRVVRSNKDSTIYDIIEETNSRNIPVVINSTDNTYINFQIIQNNSKKSYTRQMVNTEFEAWCEKNAKSPDKFDFMYNISASKDKSCKYNGVIDIVPKKNIDEIYRNGLYKISGIYPVNILINGVVPENIKNYVLLNINSEIIATVVLDGRVIEIKNLGAGVSGIIEKIKEMCGSYQKAYEICRKVNVYSDESNDVEVENIVEPILQGVIKSISTFITKYKINIECIYLTGLINLFNNLDLLLKEYFDLKCEVLVPRFVRKDEKDIAEIVEITPAIALAYNHLEDDSTNFLKKQKLHIIKNLEDRNMDMLRLALGIVTIVFVTYVAFGAIYSSRVNKMVDELNNNILEISSNESKINEDIEYISENREKYQNINEEVEKIEESLSSSGAYNVATFLQNIMRIIPEDVTLVSINSDDNKNIKLKAQSSSYASLGYFVSEIKLEGTLNDVTINEVENGDITTVEIGGELP